jgi:hypothetical protein
MQIRNLDRKPLRKIIKRQHHAPKTDHFNWGADQGNVTLVLECGHKLEKKHSQTKHKTKLRCPECDDEASRPVQERGPYRDRQEIPQDRRSLRRLPRIPQEEGHLD